MIRFILLAGLALTGISALIKEFSENTRALLCWTSATLTFVISAVVFFACYGEFSFDWKAILTGAAGAVLLCALVVMIELLAPEKRRRKRDNAPYDSREAERSLNTVFVMTCVVLAAAAAVADGIGETFMTGVCLIPAAAVSIRQLSYSLYCAKTDTARELSPQKQRENALKKLNTGQRKL